MQPDITTEEQEHILNYVYNRDSQFEIIELNS